VDKIGFTVFFYFKYLLRVIRAKEQVLITFQKYN
jgi:hypothetical protein